MAACPETLVANLRKFFSGAKLISAYEAGFSGSSLHRRLVSAGIDNLIVHAASIEVSARDKVKTDKRDSLKIATQLSAGRLRGNRVLSQAAEERRELSRSRTQQVRNRTRIMNQARMKLHFHGLLAAEQKGVLRRVMVEEIAQLQSEELQVSLESLCRVWATLDEEINRLSKKLATQAKNDVLEKTFRSIPGVGAVASRILSTELNDMSQFPNEKALLSYTGLTPMEFSSGENKRLGRISRQGNARLRAVLVECAWVAVRKDPQLKKVFEQIAYRAGKKRAIVAIARKLVGRARALCRKNTHYELNYAKKTKTVKKLTLVRFRKLK